MPTLTEAQAEYDAARAERAALLTEEMAFAADIKERKKPSRDRYIAAEAALEEARRAEEG